MNKNLNIEDIQKYTKYQLKMINLQSGGGNNTLKENTYDQKIKEYENKLKKSGVNVTKLKEIIQSGGDPINELKKTKNDIITKINELENVGNLRQQLANVQNKLKDEEKIKNSVVDKFKSFASESITGFGEVKNAIDSKANSIDIPADPSLSDNEVANKVNEILENLMS